MKCFNRDSKCVYELKTTLFEGEHDVATGGELHFSDSLFAEGKQRYDEIIIYYGSGNDFDGMNSLVMNVTDIVNGGNSKGQLLTISPDAYGSCIALLNYATIWVASEMYYDPNKMERVGGLKLIDDMYAGAEIYIPRGQLGFKTDGSIDVSKKDTCTIKIYKVEGYKY